MAQVQLFNGGEAPLVPPPPDVSRPTAGHRVGKIDLAPLRLSQAGVMPELPGYLAREVAAGGAAVAQGVNELAEVHKGLAVQIAEARDAQGLQEGMLIIEEELGAFEQWKLSDGLRSPSGWQKTWKEMSDKALGRTEDLEMSAAGRNELKARMKRFAARAGVDIGRDAANRQLELTVDAYDAGVANAVADGNAEKAIGLEIEKHGFLGSPPEVREKAVREAGAAADIAIEEKVMEAVRSYGPFVGVVQYENAKHLLSQENQEKIEAWLRRSAATARSEEFVEMANRILAPAGDPERLDSAAKLKAFLEEGNLLNAERRELAEMLEAENRPEPDRREDFLAALVLEADYDPGARGAEELADGMRRYKLIADRLSSSGARKAILDRLNAKMYGDSPEGALGRVSDAKREVQSMVMEFAKSHPLTRDKFGAGGKLDPEKFRKAALFGFGGIVDDAAYAKANAGIWDFVTAAERWVDDYAGENKGKAPNMWEEKNRAVLRDIWRQAMGGVEYMILPEVPVAEPSLFQDASGMRGADVSPEDANRAADRIRAGLVGEGG